VDQKVSIVIEAGKTEGQYWKDIFRFREVAYFMSWRDILVRYKQTVVGIAWALLRPFLTMVIFTVIFGKLAHLPSGNIPYPILVFAGMLPWQFFANAISECSTSLISNSNLLTKIYFPRLIVPLSTIGVNLIDFLISFAILAGLMVWYEFIPPWSSLCIPLLILLTLTCAMSFGLWLGALTVKYRDFRYIVPFVVQLGMYISPVGFSSAIIPSRWFYLYALNPMVGIIDAYRWCLLGDAQFPLVSLSLSTAIVIITLVTGIRYFRRTERGFADII
jgi:lipopolysaccharide transport system permease protein